MTESVNNRLNGKRNDELTPRERQECMRAMELANRDGDFRAVGQG